MKRIAFVCYSLDAAHPRELEALRDRLDAIDRGAATAGFRSFAHVRDVQGWNVDGADPLEALNAAFAEIRRASAVILDLTPHSTSRFTGLAMEAGFARSSGKPMLAVCPVGVSPKRMLFGIADAQVRYSGLPELESAVTSGLRQLTVD